MAQKNENNAKKEHKKDVKKWTIKEINPSKENLISQKKVSRKRRKRAELNGVLVYQKRFKVQVLTMLRDRPTGLDQITVLATAGMLKRHILITPVPNHSTTASHTWTALSKPPALFLT